MCFRPSSVDMTVICPGCGKKVSSMGGIRQKKCPFCKTELLEPKVKCPECGSENPISNKVCVNCGFNGKPGSGKVNK
jgi:predicted amidophosphoribosyltransferase